MNPRLQGIQEYLRQSHLLRPIEQCRYILRRVRFYEANRRFKRVHPDFALPPPHLVFDAQGTVHWESYRQTGLQLAERIAQEVKAYAPNVKSTLEWGCGPGRVIRHIHAFLGAGELVGCDYNLESIEWCEKHIQGTRFIKNELKPPLLFEDNSFDFIYAISVFTHLSNVLCITWINELFRVLKPGGIIMIWTNGDTFLPVMRTQEKQRYNSAQFVVRDKYEEGRKMFLSFHPPAWVRQTLLRRFRVLRHYPGGFSGSEQDVWIACPYK